jgi:5-carboxymethyl-2-hydroxymuconate isomerase
MPHLALECSANVPDRPDLDRVLEQLHRAMTTAGTFDLANVKSESFPRAHAGRACDITVEIREMRRDLHFKAGPPPGPGRG